MLVDDQRHTHPIRAEGSQTERTEGLDSGGDGRKAGSGSELHFRFGTGKAERELVEFRSHCQGLRCIYPTVVLKSLSVCFPGY